MEPFSKDLAAAQTKGLNVWTSLTEAGVGPNSYFATKDNDFRLLSLMVNHWVVRKCVNMNATEVASTPYGLFQPVAKGKGKSLTQFKGWKCKNVSPQRFKRFPALRKKAVEQDVDFVELTDHPLLTLLESGVDDLNGWSTRKLLAISVEGLGRGYLLKETDGFTPISGAPTKLKFLKPYYVWPMRDGEGNVIQYSYENVMDGRTVSSTMLDKEDVIAFRFPPLSDPFGGGDAWLRSVYDQAALAAKFYEYMGWLLDNRARPDYLISPKTENADKAQLKRLEQEMRIRLKGSKNGLPVVTDDAVTVTPLNWKPDDLSWIALEEQTIKAICNAADVPPALLDKDSTYANYTGSMEHWKQTAITHRVALFQSVLNNDLVPLFGDDLFLEFENPVPEDQEAELDYDKFRQAKATTLATTGTGTVNEIRNLLDLLPLEEGGDELVKPSLVTYQPEDQLDQEEPDAQDDSEDGDDDSDEPSPSDDGKSLRERSKAFDLDAILKINEQVVSGKLPRSVAISLAAKALNIEEYEAKQFISYPKADKLKTVIKAMRLPPMVVPDGASIASAVKDTYHHIKTHILEQIGTGHKSLDGIETKGANDGLPDEFRPLDTWADDLDHRVQPLIQLEVQQAANGRIKALTDIGASPDVFSVVPPNIKEAVKKRSLDLAQSTVDTTTKSLNDALSDLKQQITDGVLEGDPVAAMRDRVQQVFEGLDDAHAELIARTESSAAVHTGQQIAAKASGIVKGFKILLSDQSCDECQAVADETPEIPVDGSFATDDYDDSPLPVHPNCRCTMTEIIDMDALNSED